MKSINARSRAGPGDGSYREVAAGAQAPYGHGRLEEIYRADLGQK